MGVFLLDKNMCNAFKGDKIGATNPETGEFVPLFNPRQQNWVDHFRWEAGGAEITGLTATGRATVMALQLNRELLVEARKLWIAANLHPSP